MSTGFWWLAMLASSGLFAWWAWWAAVGLDEGSLAEHPLLLLDTEEAEDEEEEEEEEEEDEDEEDEESDVRLELARETVELAIWDKSCRWWRWWLWWWWWWPRPRLRFMLRWWWAPLGGLPW